jgi:N-acetylglucosamine-6-phosphate deacetylase
MGIYKGRHYKTGRNIAIHSTNGIITSIQECSGEQDVIIAPGLFDNQVNGYKGVGFTKPDLSASGIEKTINELCSIGVTSFLPTLITAPREILVRNLKIFRDEFVQTHNCVSAMAPCTIPGIHLEGPWLNPEPGYRGAHNPEWIRKPDIREFDELYEASGGHICHLTLAPELDGAIDLIKRCRKLGVTVGLAHHNANTEQVNKAVEAGAGLSIHLGNGLANTISRHNNPLWPQLANDSLFISLIADGFHLTKEELRTFYKVKGPGKTILTSDCSYLAGLPPKQYDWHGKTIILEPEGRIYFPEENVLAGAASPLIRDIGIMMKYTGCTLGQAIDMASLNPARFHGLTDRGELKVGQRADLILFHLLDGKIQLQQTVKGGVDVMIV